MLRLGAGLLVATWVGAAATAHAGGRPYAFTGGVETLPPLELEVENWFTAENPRGSVGTSWDWWVGPVAGLTDWVEVGLFPIFIQPAAPIGGISPGLQFAELRAQVSWLLAERGAWPVDVRLRGEYGQPVADGQRYTFWLHAILARDFGSLNLTFDPAVWLAIGKEPGATESSTEPYFDYGLGASYDLGHGIRAGGELFGTGEFSDLAESHHFLGPALGLGAGRVWASISVGIGLGHESSTARGRLVVGLLL